MRGPPPGYRRAFHAGAFHHLRPLPCQPPKRPHLLRRPRRQNQNRRRRRQSSWIYPTRSLQPFTKGTISIGTSNASPLGNCVCADGCVAHHLSTWLRVALGFWAAALMARSMPRWTRSTALALRSSAVKMCSALLWMRYARWCAATPQRHTMHNSFHRNLNTP